MKRVGSLMVLAALFLACADAAADCYGGYAYYPAGYYGSRYWSAGWYKHTPYGWYRQGYGYVTGSYCNHNYQAPPQLYTPVYPPGSYRHDPVLVPTYSVGYSPPPVDPKALPQKNGLAPPHAPGNAAAMPGYQDLLQQVAAMRQEIAALRQGRQPAGPGAPAAGVKVAALASCVRCHSEGGSGTGKAGPTMFDKAGRLVLGADDVAACVDSVLKGRMPKGAPLPDAQKVAASSELMRHLEVAAKQPPPMPAP